MQMAGPAAALVLYQEANTDAPAARERPRSRYGRAKHIGVHETLVLPMSIVPLLSHATRSSRAGPHRQPSPLPLCATGWRPPEAKVKDPRGLLVPASSSPL